MKWKIESSKLQAELAAFQKIMIHKDKILKELKEEQEPIMATLKEVQS